MDPEVGMENSKHSQLVHGELVNHHMTKPEAVSTGFVFTLSA